MAKPKRRKGESNENYNIRLQAYRRRFDPEKAPILLKNESPSSFKARVKAWESNTGKKYPTTFSGKSDAERILAGETRLPGLGIKGKDFTSEYLDQIKEYQRTKPKQSVEDRDEQQIADIASGKTDLSKIDTTPLNAEQLRIDEIFKRQSKFDKKRLDDARKAENQEIRDEVALDKELNPWGIDNIRRTTGMEVGRSDAQFTKGDGYNLTIPKNIPSDKQDQSGMGKGVEPIGTYKSDTGELDREAWLKKTANSPAAKAFGKGKKADDLRWAAQQNYRKFKRDNNRGRLGIGLFGL